MMSTPHVLVVDDEPHVRTMLKAATARALPRATIQEAASGEDALPLVSAAPADARLILLSDYRMGPDRMSGLDFLAEAGALRADAARVVITGCHRSELEPRLTEMDLDACLQKPLALAELMALLRALAAKPGGIPVDA